MILVFLLALKQLKFACIFMVYNHKFNMNLNDIMTKRSLINNCRWPFLRLLFVNFFAYFHFPRRKNMTARSISLQSLPVHCTSVFFSNLEFLVQTGIFVIKSWDF